MGYPDHPRCLTGCVPHERHPVIRVTIAVPWSGRAWGYPSHPGVGPAPFGVEVPVVWRQSPYPGYPRSPPGLRTGCPLGTGCVRGGVPGSLAVVAVPLGWEGGGTPITSS